METAYTTEIIYPCVIHYTGRNRYLDDLIYAESRGTSVFKGPDSIPLKRSTFVLGDTEKGTMMSH